MTLTGPSTPDTQDPLINRVLSDRYRILQKLGEGGMGVVYLAEHVVIEKKIALKILFPDLTRRSDLVQRFMQEAKSASRINHENVIDITDFGQSPEGYVFIAMEYLVGQDLGQLLKASGPLPWTRAQPIILQIVKALRAAHERGIVHRDVKPENVFVSPRDDGREFVKVLDFGIAKVLGLDDDAPRLTRTGMIFGTPEYMSPEQAQGQAVDHRVDIYAVGCILYHMVTGEVPFRAESFMGILSKHMLEQAVAPSVRNPTVEAAVEAVINRAMEKDPARRFQTMGEFVEALVPLGQGGDLSGGVSLATGRPVAGRASASKSSAPAISPAWAPGKLAGTASPHVTSEVSGRSSMPLVDPNPEVRRSQTEIFARDSLDSRPHVRAASATMVVVAVGAGALTILVIVFLMFRGSGTTGSASSSAGARVPVAEHSAPARAAEAKPAVSLPPGAAAQKSGTPVKEKGTASTEDLGRPHRSSRAAVDSSPLRSPSGARPRTARAKTPAELKNPFAEP